MLKLSDLNVCSKDDFVAALKGTPGADAVAKVREDVRKMLMERTNEKEEVLVPRAAAEDVDVWHPLLLGRPQHPIEGVLSAAGRAAGR